MGRGGKKKGDRREPQFGLGPSLDDLRPGPRDRVGVSDDDEPVAPKKKARDDNSREKSSSRDSSKNSSKKKQPAAKRRSVIGRIAYWGVVAGLWAGIAVFGVAVWVSAHLPPIHALEVPKRPPTIRIAGLDGSILATRGEQAGTNVSISELPPHLPQAFIAIEDRRFYSHYGIDPQGIGRAIVANVTRRGLSQGGSTITQQLAKNLFLTQERTMWRKLQEVELALWLEHKYSKKQILELYLNRVYFGSGAYGVEAAAQRYFGKSARKVTLSEAAMLAGLVKSPSRLAPNRNQDAAEARAKVVLGAMAEMGAITQTQAQATIGHPAYTVQPSGPPPSTMSRTGSPKSSTIWSAASKTTSSLKQPSIRSFRAWRKPPSSTSWRPRA